MLPITLPNWRAERCRRQRRRTNASDSTLAPGIYGEVCWLRRLRLLAASRRWADDVDQVGSEAAFLGDTSLGWPSLRRDEGSVYSAPSHNRGPGAAWRILHCSSGRRRRASRRYGHWR